MRCLLDTHTFLWFVANDAKLSRAAYQIIADPKNRLFMSIASPWEIAIKTSTGKLSLSDPFNIYMPRELAKNRVRLLPIMLTHLAIVVTLPHHHRDPFDRLLIAQSLAEGMPIIGADAAFDAYGVVRLW